MDFIEVKGARENNLKNVDCKLPKNKLIVLSGVSGSGKSSFAFDTIYKEGQRRYLESLSSYARQFIGDMSKADVDSVSGLSPSISIDQKSGSKNPRSTVGTITEISDYLRLLYARIGIPKCPIHHTEIAPLSIDEMIDKAILYEGEKVLILSPVVRGEKGTFENTFNKLRHDGYSKVIVDGINLTLDDEIKLEKNKKHEILLVVDRIIIDSSDRNRMVDSFETALKESDGMLIIRFENKDLVLSSKHSCPICGFTFPDMDPKLFSFNSPIGACDQCDGLGFKRHINPDLLIPDQSLSIKEGALKKWGSEDSMSMMQLLAFLKTNNIRDDIPFEEYKKEERDLILYGSDKPFSYTFKSKTTESVFKMGSSLFEGVINNLERRYRETESRMIREWLEMYMEDDICPKCEGKRLNDKALNVFINDYNIDDLCKVSIKDLKDIIQTFEFNDSERKIAKMLLDEVNARLDFLINVGLGYLSLNRSSGTLSGGESQRIRLATQIGSKLTGIIYVLDEPSIGLHQKDNQKLIGALKEMRDLGNTLLVVEHDLETINSADYVVDFGPKAGVHGGEIMFSGSRDEMIKSCDSLTAKYLRGDLKIEPRLNPLKAERGFIEIKGAKCHNLKNLNVKFPVGLITYVTGVSGSGKSSLVKECLAKGVIRAVTKRKVVPGEFKSIDTANIDKIVVVDQSPIGRTPRSNPATYIGVFDEIRSLFSETSLAKERSYNKSRFSFNVAGGRCEACWGDGVKRIEMNFLPDVYVECPVCHGKKYNKDTLEILFKGKSIADVLDLTVDEALEFFKNQPKIERQLKTMSEVGLGYIKLGQNSTTLSGGEAQRIKLADELNREIKPNTLYILDEPSTGLHQDDVSRLLLCLDKIREKGATVVVVEHNLDMISTADYIIDMGPTGGDNGGYIIAKGTVEEVMENSSSDTGKFLKDMIKDGKIY